MGLDMWLMRQMKPRKNDEKFNKLALDTREEVMYWRKANEVRQWLVNHTDLQRDDDCRDIPLTKEILEQLRDDCRAVTEDHDKAHLLLPTSDGFFFGSTEYDDWYFDRVEDTAERLDQIIEKTDFDNEIIIYDEWW